jgi:putative ABC transport system ATP-binding protein
LPARAQTTLFLVTHEETLARRCQRIVRLKDGRIVADESVRPHASTGSA